MNINVGRYDGSDVAKQKIEIVERKGLGHPDTICDSIMNQVSIDLSAAYLKEFGAIMHHNTDKALLVAGETMKRFGGGIVKQPMLLVFGDRATFEVGGKSIPVNEIAVNAAKKWIKNRMRFVDPEKHMKYQVELKRGSEELTDIFKRKGKVLGANDTSAAVGFAPMTKTESAVYNLEKFLNSSDFKKEFPETGEDIKVMCVRNGDNFIFTIALAFVDRFVDSEEDYFRKKDEVHERVVEFLKTKEDIKSLRVDINTLDAKGRGLGGVYLTVLGTSAEDGDCGEVGRGNRANGIIPLMRPGSTEAAAGKNPVSHVGKIYNLLTFDLADEIYKKVNGIDGVYVWLVSQIGVPIDQPLIADAQLISKTEIDEKTKKQVQEIIENRLLNIKDFCKRLIGGGIEVC